MDAETLGLTQRTPANPVLSSSNKRGRANSTDSLDVPVQPLTNKRSKSDLKSKTDTKSQEGSTAAASGPAGSASRKKKCGKCGYNNHTTEEHRDGLQGKKHKTSLASNSKPTEDTYADDSHIHDP